MENRALPDARRRLNSYQNSEHPTAGRATQQIWGCSSHSICRNHGIRFRIRHGSKNTKEQGTGIGLSTVSQIVERCAGSIDVTSEPHKGTCFCIYLPKAVAPITEEEVNLEVNMAHDVAAM